MKKIIFALLFIGLELMASNVYELTRKCTACHGANFDKSALGKSAIVYGQSAYQIEASLKGYKAGTQNKAGMGSLMKEQVAAFSDYEIKIIAEYIDSLSNAAAPAADAAAAPATDWPFVCSGTEIGRFGSNRFFKVAGNDDYPLILADTESIKIDKKNKLIQVWTIWLASYSGKLDLIRQSGKYDNYNFGYNLAHITIDYKNMRFLSDSFSRYNCDNSLITSTSISKWVNSAPNTITEDMIKSIMQKYNLK